MQGQFSTTAAFAQTTVHPCIINNQRYIVYPRGLAEQNPQLFSQLTTHYTQLGYRLKEDQRTAESGNKYRNQRRKWVPMLLFTASLLLEQPAFAESAETGAASVVQHAQQISLQLVASQSHQDTWQLQQPAKAIKKVQLVSKTAQALFSILFSRYQLKPGDPAYIENDLREIANYYSEFPMPVALLQALKGQNWVLAYDADNWVTTGSGNMLRVEKAVIHFNTRSAAQLRLNNGCDNNPVCIASPADALLHELLHAHSMLVNSEEFISQGGMNNVIYPYQHEYAVIGKERKLYAAMTRQDSLKRPQRREHTGRLVRARCATCID